METSPLLVRFKNSDLHIMNKWAINRISKEMLRHVTTTKAKAKAKAKPKKTKTITKRTKKTTAESK